MRAEARNAAPGSSFELYARAMLDHWLGKTVTVEFEREDGFRDASRIDTYFAPPSKWPRMEQEALRLVRGRVLDVGCGPGRHALFLQKKGFDVVGIDASATQVALARIRGVLQVYPASVQRLPRGLGTFDTVLMMGNNLGLAGDVPRVRRFLRDLREITRKGARLIGHSRIPGTWSEDHLPYVKSNIRRKRPPGLITLRVRYKGRVGDWFDLLLISPDAFAALAHDTGWDLVRVIWEGGYGPGDYIAVAERR
ncbi:MAG TPA: class I SAM-dependent methyltransferase [Thermoplasmata archaeon]|nr:class I SAM-dependent methyltransferase [Thermoplasmata archaeon]